MTRTSRKKKSFKSSKSDKKKDEIIANNELMSLFIGYKQRLKIYNHYIRPKIHVPKGSKYRELSGNYQMGGSSNKITSNKLVISRVIPKSGVEINFANTFDSVLLGPSEKRLLFKSSDSTHQFELQKALKAVAKNTNDKSDSVWIKLKGYIDTGPITVDYASTRKLCIKYVHELNYKFRKELTRFRNIREVVDEDNEEEIVYLLVYGSYNDKNNLPYLEIEEIFRLSGIKIASYSKLEDLVYSGPLLDTDKKDNIDVETDIDSDNANDSDDIVEGEEIDTRYDVIAPEIRCMNCDLTFTDKITLKEHMKNDHSGAKTIGDIFNQKLEESGFGSDSGAASGSDDSFF